MLHKSVSALKYIE